MTWLGDIYPAKFSSREPFSNNNAKNKIMKIYLTILSVFSNFWLLGQNDSGVNVDFGAYVEPYFSYDFNKPESGDRPFLYSHNRHNEFNVNLGYLKASCTAPRFRANAAIGLGTYMRSNYATEPSEFRNILELNAGLRLSKKHDFWLDLGVMPSHIGFESAVGKDCPTLTRGLGAEGSPYFETGAKLGYTTPNGLLTFSVLLLNGWQNIQRAAGNSLSSFGSQIQFKSERITLNSSTFVGTNTPDDARRMRYFQDLYGIFQVSDKLGITLGVDYGLEEQAPGSRDLNSWASTVGILRYEVSDRFALAARGEYFSDENGVIFPTGTPKGFKVAGLSLNLDWVVSSHALWRIEGRILNSQDKIFLKNGTLSNTDAFLTTAIAVSF